MAFKGIIEYGTTYTPAQYDNETTFQIANAAPIDGSVMKVLTNTGVDFGTALWEGTTYTISDLSQSLAYFQSRGRKGWDRLKYNFVKAQICNSVSGLPVDWFTTATVNAYKANMKLLADFALAAGFYGVWLDVEPYVNQWLYDTMPDKGSHIYSAYQAQVTAVADEIFDYWRATYPALNVMTTFAYEGYATTGGADSLNPYGLYVSFLDAMLDSYGSSGGSGKIILSTESAYSSLLVSGVTRYALPYINGTFDSYSRHGSIPDDAGSPAPTAAYKGSSTYFGRRSVVDYALAPWITKTPFNPATPTTNYFTPASFGRLLRLMMDLSEWVWIYDPDYPLYVASGSNVGTTYLDEIRLCRKQQGLDQGAGGSNLVIAYPSIPFDAATVTTSATATSGHDKENLVTGSRGDYYELASNTTDDVYFNYDLGSGVTNTANIFGVLRASMLKPGSGVLGGVTARLRGSTQSAFTPSSISGLTLWLDATRGVTYSSTVGDENPVSQWSDQSGNANHFTQVTSANRPLLVAASVGADSNQTYSGGINGNAAIKFDGTNDFMSGAGTLTNYIANNACTVFIVFQPIAISAGGASMYQNDGLFQATNSAFSINVKQSDKFGGYNESSGENVSVTGTSLTSVNIGHFRHDAGSIIASVNNGTEATTVSGNTTPLSAGVQIGLAASGSHYFNGYICEVLIWYVVLSLGDRTKVYEYLRDKWQTAAVSIRGSLDFTDLDGPRGEDLVTTFATSSAYRHWWVQLSTTTTQKFRHGKHYLGNALDLGRDPEYAIVHKRKVAGAGARDAGFEVDLKWTGISDAKRKTLIDNVLKYKDTNPIILVETVDNIFGGFHSIHGFITDCKITPVSVNSNDITMKVLECI